MFEGALGLGGIDYLLQCIVDTDPESISAQWQRMLGRLYMLEHLIQERAVDFKALSFVDGSNAADISTEPHECYVRTFIVLRFVAKHISYPHAKAAKLAYRVFCQVATLQVAVGGKAIVEQACLLLQSADAQIQLRIRRKLQSVASGSYAISRARMFASGMSSPSTSPVVFFVSAQPAPKLEVVTDSLNHANGVGDSELSPQQVESVICNTKVLPRADKERDYSIEAGSAAQNQFVYEDAVVISKQAAMIDSAVQTSPSLFRRKNRLIRAASSMDDNSDVDLATSSRVYSLHASDSTALMDSHGSASGSHGSTSGMTDDLMDFSESMRTDVEKVSFKREVASSLNDSLEGNGGMMWAKLFNRVCCCCDCCLT